MSSSACDYSLSYDVPFVTEDPRRKIVFFDLETTIPLRKNDHFEILEFAAVVIQFDGFYEVYSYQTLIQPQDFSLISSTSVNCNGISRDMVKSAPKFDEVAEGIFRLLEGQVWAGHNIMKFDILRLKEAFSRIGRRAPEASGVIDTLSLLKSTFGPRAGNMKMASIGNYCGLGEQSHRGLGDVRMNVEILKQCSTMLFLEHHFPPLSASPPPCGSDSSSDVAQALQLLSLGPSKGPEPSSQIPQTPGASGKPPPVLSHVHLPVSAAEGAKIEPLPPSKVLPAGELSRLGPFARKDKASTDPCTVQEADFARWAPLSPEGDDDRLDEAGPAAVVESSADPQKGASKDGKGILGISLLSWMNPWASEQPGGTGSDQESYSLLEELAMAEEDLFSQFFKMWPSREDSGGHEEFRSRFSEQQKKASSSVSVSGGVEYSALESALRKVSSGQQNEKKVPERALSSGVESSALESALKKLEREEKARSRNRQEDSVVSVLERTAAKLELVDGVQKLPEASVNCREWSFPQAVDSRNADPSSLRIVPSDWGRSLVGFSGEFFQYDGQHLVVRDSWVRVKCSVSDSYAFDGNRRPRFNILVEPSQATCRLLSVCDQLLVQHCSQVGDLSICRGTILDEKSSLPAVRIKIATTGVRGEEAAYRTRFFKRAGPSWQVCNEEVPMAAVEPSEFRRCIPEGSFLDLTFRVDTYKVEGVRGLRLLALVIALL